MAQAKSPDSSPPDLKGRAVSGVFSVLPEELTVITDKSHGLYDERVHWPVDEDLVLSIMAHGVREVVHARRNGRALEVTNGRQRTKACLEANRRLRERGEPPRRIKVIVEGGDERDHAAAGVILNEGIIRRPTEVLIKARKAQRLLRLHGYTLAEVAGMFFVSQETIENWLKLNDLHREVRAYVERGRVKYTVAMRLAALPREQQVAKLREIMTAGATNANAVRAVVNGKLEKVHPPTRQQLRRLADAFVRAENFLAGDRASDVYAFCSWVLGRISTDEFLSSLSSSEAGPIGEAVRLVMAPKGSSAAGKSAGANGKVDPRCRR